MREFTRFITLEMEACYGSAEFFHHTTFVDIFSLTSHLLGYIIDVTFIGWVAEFSKKGSVRADNLLPLSRMHGTHNWIVWRHVANDLLPSHRPTRAACWPTACRSAPRAVVCWF